MNNGFSFMYTISLKTEFFDKAVNPVLCGSDICPTNIHITNIPNSTNLSLFYTHNYIFLLLICMLYNL